MRRVRFRHENREKEGTLIDERLDGVDLVGVHHNGETFWIPPDLVVPEKETVVESAEEPPKKRQKQSHLPSVAIRHPVVWLCWEYLPDSTWVERHLVQRWWSLDDDAEFNDELAQQNDAFLCEKIKSEVLKVMKIEGDLFGWFREIGGFISGSSMLGWAHGIDPFDKWEADLDIFTFSPSDLLKQSQTNPIYRKKSKYDYTKHVGCVVDSIKFRFYEKPHVTLNLVCIKNPLTTTFEPQESPEATEVVDSVGYAHGLTRLSRRYDTMQEYVLDNFDLDILCNTFDGTTLRIGDGSIRARDRLAMMLATYQRRPMDDACRLLARIRKYQLRGMTLCNHKDVALHVGSQILSNVKLAVV